MNAPVVSVIIPTYNRLDFVEKAIDSIFCQTFKDYEIIVIDDGSTDGTGKMIKEKYQEKIVYRWQENQGESYARNCGLSMAQGKYIAFLDSDDMWRPDKLAIQVDILENPKNAEAVLIFSNAYEIDENGILIQPNPIGRLRKDEKLTLAGMQRGPKMHGPPSNVLIRSDILKETGGFDPSIRYGEDWDLVIRLRSKGKFVYVDEPLWYYRVHGKSQQGIPKAESLSTYLEDTLKILQKNETLLFAGDKSKYYKTQAWIYEKVAAWCFVRECWEQGTNYIIESSKLHAMHHSSANLAFRIGYWKALVLSGQLGAPKLAEDYLISIFLPQLAQHWPSYLLKLPRKKIMGVFYQFLAFLPGMEKSATRAFCIKAIKLNPRFLISPRTMRVLVSSFV